MQDFDREQDFEHDAEFVRLEGLKTGFAERVAVAVEAFQHGGPDLEKKLAQEAERLPKEIVEECKAANVRAWGRARPKPVLKVVPKAEPAFKRREFWKEKPKLKAVDDVGPPKIDGAPNVSGEAKSKAEPAQPLGVVPLGFTQSPTIAPAVADEGLLCLDPAAPFDNAQKLVSLRAWHPGERIRTWQYWQRSFWQWSGTHWREVDDDTGRVLRGLIGAENYIGTSLKAFSEQFGMENFVGKKVAVFSDARLDGVLLGMVGAIANSPRSSALSYQPSPPAARAKSMARTILSAIPSFTGSD